MSVSKFLILIKVSCLTVEVSSVGNFDLYRSCRLRQHVTSVDILSYYIVKKLLKMIFSIHLKFLHNFYVCNLNTDEEQLWQPEVMAWQLRQKLPPAFRKVTCNRTREREIFAVWGDCNRWLHCLLACAIPFLWRILSECYCFLAIMVTGRDTRKWELRGGGYCNPIYQPSKSCLLFSCTRYRWIFMINIDVGGTRVFTTPRNWNLTTPKELQMY
jgi:hypothetical protein